MKLAGLAISAAFILTTWAACRSFDEPPENRGSRTLIEFGWDEPDPAFLRDHLPEMDRSFFDGCVFHLTFKDASGPADFLWKAWGSRRFEEAGFAENRRILASLKPRRFKKNLIRFNVTPGKLDWFDDHSAVLANARAVADLAKGGPCIGILLDTEQYEGKLFDYRQQRDSQTKTWDEYARQARRRGGELMEAFQERFPDLTVLLTFGHSYVRISSGRGKIPLAECENGLLAPFLDGMIDAARGDSRLIDGFESSYGYKERERFVKARDLITSEAAQIAADPKRYRERVSPGFGLWLDYDWRRRGWDLDDVDRNYFTTDSFAASLQSALECSSDVVWIYTETPRWWTPEGRTSKLPPAYEAAIRKTLDMPRNRHPR